MHWTASEINWQAADVGVLKAIFYSLGLSLNSPGFVRTAGGGRFREETARLCGKTPLSQAIQLALCYAGAGILGSELLQQRIMAISQQLAGLVHFAQVLEHERQI